MHAGTFGIGGRSFGWLSCTVGLSWSYIKVDISACEFSLFSVRLASEKLIRSFLSPRLMIEPVHIFV